jgi:hypothetical protein
MLYLELAFWLLMQHTKINNWIIVIMLWFRRAVTHISTSMNGYAVRNVAIYSSECVAMPPHH